MKALAQLQDIITSLKKVNSNLLVVYSMNSHLLQDAMLAQSSQIMLTQIQLYVQKNLTSFVQKFESQLNKKLNEYEEKFKRESHTRRMLDLQQTKMDYVTTGQDILYLKKELEEEIEDSKEESKIMSQPKVELKIQGLMETSSLRGISDNRQNQQKSQESFYTVEEIESFQELKKKYLGFMEDKDWYKEDKINSREYGRSSSEKFESIDQRLALLAAKIEQSTQTQKEGILQWKTYETQITHGNSRQSIRRCKSKDEVQSQLYDIIYGPDLLNFVQYYMWKKNKKQFPTPPQSPHNINSPSNNTPLHSPSHQQKQNQPHTSDKRSPLISYLTKGKTSQQLQPQNLIETKYQRLVVICFDTLLYAMKNMEYFLPVGYITETIMQIEREELATLRADDLKKRQGEIEKCCKQVIRKMRQLRAEIKLESGFSSNFFNVETEIQIKIK